MYICVPVTRLTGLTKNKIEQEDMKLRGICVGSNRGRVRGVGLNGDHISLYTSTIISENFTHAYNEIVKGNNDEITIQELCITLILFQRRPIGMILPHSFQL